ncbi:MAG TPA: pyridoxamine 5'-phosphate oxidase [Nitrospiria bacterium]|nr:pyridoxamine 5'-phosphate oxidase [Candidatus Manganitrophaceae bacterium]HIL34511.1 pyridoxamine 5'-phosphate oxidase [Candidatus Manganitrophaceae bacterium]
MKESSDPIARFTAVFEVAKNTFPYDATACTLATTGSGGKPSARVVLLKDFDDCGFVIYTNLESRKGKEMSTTPYAALCFYWPQLNVQVRIEGLVAQVSHAEADAYFATRPRGTQIGAWASRQSAPFSDRSELEKRIKIYEEKFVGEDVPRPPFWSGFRIISEKIEFWTAKEDRLHDRVLYTREDRKWTIDRLYP